MTWPDVAASFIEFLDANSAAVAALGVVILTALFAFLRDWLARRKELQHKRLEWRREFCESYLYKPIMAFIDEWLGLVDRTYSALLVLEAGEKPLVSAEEYQAMQHALEPKFTLIFARVDAVGNVRLSQAFDDLVTHLRAFWGAFSQRDMIQLQRERGEIKESAASVLAHIIPQAGQS